MATFDHNSPSVIFTKRELKAMLLACEMFGVEIKQERVESLRPAADVGFNATIAQATYHGLAAIVAAGCRLGHPSEDRLFHRNHILCSMVSRQRIA